MEPGSAWRSAPAALKAAAGLFILEIAVIGGGVVGALLTGAWPTARETSSPGAVTALSVLGLFLVLGCLGTLAVGLVAGRKSRLRRAEGLIFQAVVLLVSIDALVGGASAWLFLGVVLSVSIDGLLLFPSSRSFGGAVRPRGQGRTTEG